MHFIDQIGHKIELASFPKRIISVVPSQTELLFDLGLEDEVVGITKFCIHPQVWFKNKKRVGGTKNLNIDKIKELQPDLIIANKEENTQEQIEQLQQLFPVWTSDISNLNDSVQMIQEVGKLTGKQAQSNQIVEKIANEFRKLKSLKNTKRVLYLIWKEPYMSVGFSTFIHDILNKAGFENVTQNDERYPNLDLKEIANLKPDLIFLSTEPYPFKEKHINEFKNLFPDIQTILVDGEMFSWYGSRLIKSPEYLIDLHDKIS
ncbi:MAG: ABC transporter substrate-binding protein [Flavobacteriales bacterium]|nr:ABC transporter substrate-binding protein [Flavobacteriales bacterium]